MYSGWTRRRFLAVTAAAGAGLAWPRTAMAENPGKMIVALAQNPGSVVEGKLVQGEVDAMVAAVVVKVTGKENADAAWRAIVPGSKDRVMLKFNALFRKATTSPEVIVSVVKGLVHAGIAEERIFLFDNCREDYKTLGMHKVPGFDGVRCLAGLEDGGFGADIKVGPVTTQLAKILTDQTDVIINLSRLKHHQLAGMTAALKNHVGSIPKAGANDLHRCLENLADLNALPPIRDRTRLAIIDGLIGIFDKGPTYQPGFTWEARAMIGSTDPVAADAVGHKVLLDYRATLPQYKQSTEMNPPVKFLARAGTIGLGVADLSKIDVVKA
jgi:uncharacterized protein (DUF362 family)